MVCNSLLFLEGACDGIPRNESCRIRDFRRRHGAMADSLRSLRNQDAVVDVSEKCCYGCKRLHAVPGTVSPNLGLCGHALMKHVLTQVNRPREHSGGTSTDASGTELPQVTLESHLCRDEG